MGNALPDANELWVGISGHFDSLSQVMCEFLDNSISNLIAHNPINKTISIVVKENETGTYSFTVEDTGTGISDFDEALRLGSKKLKNTPLNEHGFGLKHALATADPKNENWSIYTRTQEDFERQEVRKVSAPYVFDYEEEKLDAKQWPGNQNGAGTILQFTCSSDLFYTLRKGFSSNAGFTRCLDYLNEDLGYTYGDLLTKNGITINIIAPDEEIRKVVSPVSPRWVNYYPNHSPNTVKKDFGKGTVNVEYEIGEMAESDYTRYYKRSMSTQGIELRINGRLLESGIFKEIWGIEKHPAFNHFLGKINIVSNDSSKLPVTRTSKNGVRADDVVLNNLYNWIGNTFPKPKEKTTDAHSEKELVRKLAENKELHIRAEDKHIQPEFEVFEQLEGNVFADLYLFDGDDMVVYEAKKENANVQDFYQLLMYWDGLVSDGKKPDEGILLASAFSKGIDAIFEDYNQRKDSNGNHYKFTKKTWIEEGMDLEQI